MNTRTVTAPHGAFDATTTVPGDKSLSHRAFIMSAMAPGVSEVVNAGTGRDVGATVDALRMFGVAVDGGRVTSNGVEEWTAPHGPIDCGNSGTTMRLLAGALAGRPFRSTLRGDASLQSRPMGRLRAPLAALGSVVELSDHDTAPVTVGTHDTLHGADVSIEIASAQVRTAFTLAALQAEGPSTVTSPAGYRDHTERWLSALGLGVREEGERFRVYPGTIPAGRWVVPGDPSSAAFLWAAAAARTGARVTTEQVSLNPGRIGFLQVLEDMGAVVEAEVTGSVGGEPIGDVTVTGRRLDAVAVSGALTVATLDELPLVAVLGCLAEGVTRVSNAAELRAKESDRIGSTVAMVTSLGGGAADTGDGFEVVGTGWLDPGVVSAAGDHRIAMAAAVAAAGCTGPVTIEGAEVANVSWPGFYEVLEAAWSSQ